jgi:hypothetical protein
VGIDDGGRHRVDGDIDLLVLDHVVSDYRADDRRDAEDMDPRWTWGRRIAGITAVASNEVADDESRSR